MSERFRPVDDEARQRARSEHDTSFVLEAGAGTGKTTLLVDRIEALVRSGRARLEEIAAVTFTENAATTMKLRLRDRLERARAGGGSAQERERVQSALDVLERAQISTIHALCNAILSERPLECGVPPGFRVADEAEMDVLFGLAWQEWLTERLVAGDEVLLDAVDAQIPLEGDGWGERTSLRGLARVLVEQRDLAPLRAEGVADPARWREELLDEAKKAAVLLPDVKAGDLLATRLGVLVAFAQSARFLSGDDLRVHLLGMMTIPGNIRGQRAAWPSVEVMEEGRRIAAWTGEAARRWAAARGADLHGRLVTALLGVALRYDELKRERGVLDFVDLLVKARDALRDRESVRRHVRQRFRVLLVDEFQDTDPLQVQIADLLAGDDPGALVVVGDAKQSIYRFRRAEVALFRSASARARQSAGHAVLHLTQNFRSRGAILRFVNRAFTALITESAEADQPAYEPIAPPPGLSEEPSVLGLRFEAPMAGGDDLLGAESAALARLVAHAARGAFEVRDPHTQVARKSRAGDVMVLSRRLTQMRHLEEALEGASLRFTVEGGKSFFDRQEVHEALAVLRAVDDPGDRVSLVAALRSSFCGVSDRDIVAYALTGGPLWMDAVPADNPRAEALTPALALLAELHRARTSLSVPALIERLYDETRILAALTGTRRGEAQVANLEKVVVLARKASELGVLTLRGFTGLLQERIRTAREEPDLPTTRPGDLDTVRILTVHKAKGLEAPIVVLFDTADNAPTNVDAVPLWDEERIALGFRAGCQPPGWDGLVKREQARLVAEQRRLLYVACTRARDLLVVPCPPRDAQVGRFWRDLIEQLPPADDADVRFVDAATLPAPEPPEKVGDLRALAEASGGDPVATRWEALRAERIAVAGRRPYVPVSVTTAAGRTAPPPVAIVATGGGRDFGALVHRILEWVPLEEPERVPAMAQALAPAFGLDAEAAGRAAAAAQGALATPVIGRARAATRVWRELPLWFPDGEALVEGVIDLVFEEEEGLVVVDYKTDQIAAEHALVQAAHHAPQLQLYGRGLAQALGRPVRERLVLFTALGRAVPV